MFFPKNFKVIFKKEGQIALITLLIMVVILTVGLSVVSRSITDVGLSESKETGVRTFSAAEAGIEEALSKAVLPEGPLPRLDFEGVTADVDVEHVKTAEALVKRNDMLEVPLTGGTATGVRISWTKNNNTEENPGSCSEGAGSAPASLEIIRWRSEEGEAIARRYLYNASSCQSLATSNAFLTAADIPSDGFLSAVNLTIDSNDIALRLRTIYNKATVFVEPTEGNLPVQQYFISSEAQAQTGETRKIEVRRTAAGLPAVFDYALFSGGSITK